MHYYRASAVLPIIRWLLRFYSPKEYPLCSSSWFRKLWAAHHLSRSCFNLHVQDFTFSCNKSAKLAVDLHHAGIFCFEHRYLTCLCSMNQYSCKAATAIGPSQDIAAILNIIARWESGARRVASLACPCYSFLRSSTLPLV